MKAIRALAIVFCSLIVFTSQSRGNSFVDNWDQFEKKAFPLSEVSDVAQYLTRGPLLNVLISEKNTGALLQMSELRQRPVLQSAAVLSLLQLDPALGLTQGLKVIGSISPTNGILLSTLVSALRSTPKLQIVARSAGEAFRNAPVSAWRAMNAVSVLSDAEIRTLYSEKAFDSIQPVFEILMLNRLIKSTEKPTETQTLAMYTRIREVTKLPGLARVAYLMYGRADDEEFSTVLASVLGTEELQNEDLRMIVVFKSQYFTDHFNELEKILSKEQLKLLRTLLN